MLGLLVFGNVCFCTTIPGRRFSAPTIDVIETKNHNSQIINHNSQIIIHKS